MNSRDRFLSAFGDDVPDRPPAWIMRQAGRYLPEYRALKEKYDFLTLVKTPELATEVTLQPLRRFPQLDAAIIFSDILIIPEAMGQGYSFHPEGGIRMEYRLDSEARIRALQPEAVRERTAYLPAALRRVHGELAGSHALLGFGGAPFTLATYMIEGGSTRDFSRTRALLHEQPGLFGLLMEKLTMAVTELFRSEAEAGVDALQIFDSWAAALPEEDYEQASLRWIRTLAKELSGEVPVILFAKGKGETAPALASTGAAALAADPEVDLPRWREELGPEITLQGNLDPALMAGEAEPAVAATRELLEGMRPFRRYIFNLGHGITPKARIETVRAVLECLDSTGRAC